MISEIIGKLIARQNLSHEEMKSTMDTIMDGQCTNAQIGAFLATLRAKGETIEEISAAVEVLRAKASIVPVSKPNVIDTCGTGGDHSGSFNISTASAIIAAGAGVPVAKHGNKAMSSSCGSANVLQELGLNLDLTPEQVGESIDKYNIGFLFAMKLHSAMRYVGPARQELAQRTIFNILGPMLNPANAKRQIIGVFDPELLMTLATVLQKTGSERVMIVHGNDGLDEISLTSTTQVAELKDGKISQYEINPEELGLKLCSTDDLKGGSPTDNANIIRDILKGDKGPKRDICLLNAAAALYIAGVADDLPQGMQKAAEAIDSGAAQKTLDDFIAFSG
ncbi:MAG: anthranilate phosphoribosyltransferase [Fibrobacteria bacterium]|nr:anthranilate phosphoribosyltransferase [Fibrobacteria bacterium]